MTVTVEELSKAMRAAVAERLANTPADDPKMVGYKLDQGDPEPTCCEGQPHHVTLGYDAKTMKDARDFIAARDEFESFRGDSLLRDPRAAGSPEWLDALDRLRALHHEKTAQYGGADDAFENVTASAKCGVEPWRRALCDLSDCVVRMQKYAQGQPVDPTNALLDAANWALICLIKMEEGDA
jgi:hypothetical protein